MIDYSEGKIYILKTDKDNKVYINHTIQKLNMRLFNHHASTCTNPPGVH